MSPGWIIALGAWGSFIVWLVYEMVRAPLLPDEPVTWLYGIDPASVHDLDDSCEDEFAHDMDRLSRLRFYDVAEWQ